MDDNQGGDEAELGPDAALDALLEYLHKSRGFDFTGYKRTSLARRIRRRMQAVGLTTLAEYMDHLEVHPNEFPQLFNTLLINVTSFFRDEAAWQALRERLPTVIDVAGDGPVRVWSAGCSTGEEPYTLAMALCELMGVEAFGRRVKIYATDIDEEALKAARLAVYAPKAIEAIPPALVAKYFIQSPASYAFHPDLRRSVIFGRHDLVQDAPIPRVCVLLCRNTLMYFNAEAQTRILSRLQFALDPKGILMLGKAELLLTHGDLFTPLDLKQRLFGRTPKPARTRERLVAEALALPPSFTADDRALIERSAFEASPVAQIVVDGSGRLALSNKLARILLGISAEDYGRRFHELDLAYRPAELRASVDKVRAERQPVHLHGVEREVTTGEKTHFDIEVVPLVFDGGRLHAVQVSFLDVSVSQQLLAEVRKSREELVVAQNDLQSTNEELETTTEELQSTVEELETTNEELESTNEELEAMNEELQATNEELQTINEELRLRGVELNGVNTFYSAVLASLRSGIVVLTRDLLIETWNESMHELWGLRLDEVVGRHFLNLDIGLPVDQLTTAVRACISTGETSERTLSCTNRRGRQITCKVSIAPLREDTSRRVILNVEEQP